MKFLLRPGWIALVVAVIGFAVAAFTLLAPWQFGREEQREAQQRAIDVASATAPVPLDELVPPGEQVTPADEWRQVTVTGAFEPDGEALVRLRVVDGQPAVEVLSPFRTDDGRLFIVNRGSVAVASGATVPDYAPPPAGPVTLTARLRLDETDPQHREAIETDGHRQIYAADSRALATATGLPLEPGFLQLADGQPGVLRPLAVAPTTGGSAPFTNFSYALQWLTFGVIALFALGYFVRLELLQRRGAGPDRRAGRAALRRALAGEDEREGSR
ncbi:SURF1 family cytochrome oxidase biogenesis protein [Pseudonocardia adelaidensis]|uniref:SURF1-like protein n=1 Tax=Pseudonocardia adelaidensis TaxID=648754 RepID=A0ABP9NZ56_9PSEU